MARRFLMVVLAIGASLGFASGIRAVCWHAGGPGFHGRWYGAGEHHREFEEHVADVCARSAQRVFRERGAAEAKPAPAP
jgi:hypothetical protein